MKKIFTLAMLVVSLATIAQSKNDAKRDSKKEKTTQKNSRGSKDSHFGSVITKDNAVEVSTLPELVKDKENVSVKIKGVIKAVCQVKGCWITTDLGNGKSMRIRFKDYAFFMPKDADGTTFYAYGIANTETTSVAQLRHYAEDAGKSAEEIAKITEPKVEITFLAEGVILETVKKKK
jgi:hypothetical protein